MKNHQKSGRMEVMPQMQRERRGKTVKLRCHCGTEFRADPDSGRHMEGDSPQCPSCHCVWDGKDRAVKETGKKRYALIAEVDGEKVLVHIGRAPGIRDFMADATVRLGSEPDGIKACKISKKLYRQLNKLLKPAVEPART